MLQEQPLQAAMHHHSCVIHGQVSDKSHCCEVQPLLWGRESSAGSSQSVIPSPHLTPKTLTSAES